MEPQQILLPCSSTSQASHKPCMPRCIVSSTTRMSSRRKSSSPSPSPAREKLARMKKWSPGMFCTLLYSEKDRKKYMQLKKSRSHSPSLPCEKLARMNWSPGMLGTLPQSVRKTIKRKEMVQPAWGNSWVGKCTWVAARTWG